MVKFADTQKDKEQRRLQQQLAQQMQQLNTATWGNLTGLGGLTPQYLAVSSCGWGWGDMGSPGGERALPLELFQTPCSLSTPKAQPRDAVSARKFLALVQSFSR